MQTLEQPPGDLEPSCAALARVCCMTLIKFLCLAAPHSTCEMKTIISPFSHILLGLFNFSCQLLQEEAVHLVLLLPGSEHTVPHISLFSPVINVFLSSKVRAADFKDSARKRKSIPEVCIFQGDSLGNRTNAIIPDPQEEIASV